VVVVGGIVTLIIFAVKPALFTIKTVASI
jgi:hypothetical protein